MDFNITFHAVDVLTVIGTPLIGYLGYLGLTKLFADRIATRLPSRYTNRFDRILTNGLAHSIYAAIASVASTEKSGAMAGQAWQSKLVHAEYDEQDNLFSRHEYYDLKPIFVNDASSSVFPITKSPPFNEEIDIVRVFTRDLTGQNPEFAKKFFTHHFVDIENNGHHFIVEKEPSYILIQSCPTPENSCGRIPIVWRRRNGEERKYLKTLRIAAEMRMNHEAPRKSMADVIKWILEDKQLEESYHLTESSCQDFARNVCMRALSLPYTNPAKYKSIFPFRKYILFIVLAMQSVNMAFQYFAFMTTSESCL